MAVLGTSVARGLSVRAGARSPLAGVAGFWSRLGPKGRIVLFAFLIWFTPWLSSAQSKEYQVKAAFLYNFAQFVLWPATAFTNASEPFRIGVLGENPFGKALEEMVRGETIQGRPIQIVESSKIEKLAGCQILFISKSEVARFNEVFSKLDSRPVLTVSEAPGFLQQGGVVNFYRDGPKVRFEINPEAAGKNGLKLGSELLAVGKITHADTGAK
jgi:hypothetical protein